MNYQIFSENEWIYPDTVLGENVKADLHSARNADVCFQVLTDKMLSGGESISVSAEGLSGEVIVYQLLPAYVEQNSDATIFTTLDYESVKHFVTRKAPFEVYDITRPIEDGTLWAGRAAFYVRLNVDEAAVPGLYEGAVELQIDEEKLVLPVSLTVYEAQVPKLKDSVFHMVNWIYYPWLAEMHGVEVGSDEYRKLLCAYFENQIEMRNDYLMIPAGDPVRDEEGRVVDFDFSHAAMVGNLALQYGFKYVMGGFTARWLQWDRDDIYLLWDKAISVTSMEGYRQMKLYFTKAWECVVENHWQEHYMQCLVDEPQQRNALSYRAMSGICRKCMPGVIINDPVETHNIQGALDVWVVKQATYEKDIAEYQNLQKLGEEVWIYTCGYPAGSMMNRVMDLPLTVSRLPMWMCYLYRCPGFLHYGYHLHREEVERDTCPRTASGKRLPAGNSFVVYPARNGELKPWYAVRGHIQRQAACDYELFELLAKKKSAETADELIRKVCRGFNDYEPSAELFDRVHRELLGLLG